MSDESALAKRPYDLVVVGDLNPDLVLTGDDVVPAFGEVEKLVDSAELLLGGSGAITASQAARLGLATAFVGQVGDDLMGRWCLEVLEASGVDVSRCLAKKGVPTGITVVLAGPEDRAMLTFGGALGSFAASDVPVDILTAGRHLHFAGFFLQPRLSRGVAAMALSARRSGTVVSLDPNGDPARRWDSGIEKAIAEVDIAFFNEDEARGVAAALEEGESFEDANVAGAAISRRVATVVVKNGAAGAMLFSGPVSRSVSVPLFEDGRVVDTTGAGDSFDAGFIAGRLAGLSDQDSLLVACYCGSQVVTAPGGTAAQPTAGDVFEDLGIRL